MASRVVTSHDLASFTRQVVEARAAADAGQATSMLRAFFYRSLAGRRPRRTPISPEAIRQVLIIRPDAIGDYVVTTPLVDWITRHLPNTQIDLLVQPHNLPLAVQDPRFRSVGIVDYSASILRQWQQVRSFTRAIRYDMVVALSVHRITRIILMARAAGRHPIRVGAEQPTRNETYRQFFDHMIGHWSPLRHWCDSYAAAGPALTGLPLDPDVAPWVSLECGEPLPGVVDVVVNISAREAKRSWKSNAVIATLALLWHAQPELSVAVIAGPHDHERAISLVEQISHARCSYVNVGVECLPRLASAARVVVSPDTAMVHIASAVHTPVVGLYLEDHKVVEWGPYRVPFRALISDDPLNLDAISPGEIAGQILDLLKEVGATREPLS